MEDPILIKALEEAKAIRFSATAEERSRLEWDKLTFLNSRWSLYGQMTGSDLEERAGELYRECSKPCSRSLVKIVAPAHPEWEGFDHRFTFSFLEFYLYNHMEMVKGFVHYIQGHINTIPIPEPSHKRKGRS